jgi:hypothetical protein
MVVVVISVIAEVVEEVVEEVVVGVTSSMCGTRRRVHGTVVAQLVRITCCDISPTVDETGTTSEGR